MAPILHTAAPPFNRWSNRRGVSSGGPVPWRQAWAEAPNAASSDVRFPGNALDATISRERMPWTHQGYYCPPDFLVNWTEAGPIRPSLHMRNVTMRTMVGTTNTRAQDPVPAGPGIQDGNGSLPGGIRNLNSAGYEVPTNVTPHGMHTHVRGKTPQSTTRYFAQSAQMRPGRQNRLSNSRGQGQSYSQTTIHQGG
jgi:hypothetical protein